MQVDMQPKLAMCAKSYEGVQLVRIAGLWHGKIKMGKKFPLLTILPATMALLV